MEDSVGALYVGDLNPEVTESVLFEKFRKVGWLDSIKVCRDRLTGRSLRYAYVNFRKLSDARRAKATLNYDPIMGRPCRIMWSQRDPSLRRSGVGNVLIKNLDHSIDSKALKGTMDAFGNILSCKVQTDDQGLSLGFGFAHYTTPESADLAIQNAQGRLLKDKVASVCHFQNREARKQALVKSYTNVYVKNFGNDFDATQLRTYFATYGKILSAVVMKDDTGKSLGYGFVDFATHDAAARAVGAMNGCVIKGRAIYCGRAQKKKERQRDIVQSYRNVYVKNFGKDFDATQLRTCFAPYGKILSAVVMEDDSGHSLGYGFVDFATHDAAARAVDAMNGSFIKGRAIYCGRAQKKKERQRELQQRR